VTPVGAIGGWASCLANHPPAMSHAFSPMLGHTRSCGLKLHQPMVDCRRMARGSLMAQPCEVALGSKAWCGVMVCTPVLVSACLNRAVLGQGDNTLSGRSGAEAKEAP